MMGSPNRGADTTLDRPVPAVSFMPVESPYAAVPAALEFAPRDALVFWEEEHADQYKRVLGVVVGNKLKLVKITVGRDSGLEILCEAPLVEEPGVLRSGFVTRDALVLWAEPRVPRGVGKTIVVRIGAVLKMLRITGDEDRPAIEVLHSIDTTA
jgi:hypothetical protein